MGDKIIQQAAEDFDNWCDENINADSDTLSEAGKRGFIAGANFMKEKMYSKDEVIKMIAKTIEYCNDEAGRAIINVDEFLKLNSLLK